MCLLCVLIKLMFALKVIGALHIQFLLLRFTLQLITTLLAGESEYENIFQMHFCD